MLRVVAAQNEKNSLYMLYALINMIKAIGIRKVVQLANYSQLVYTEPSWLLHPTACKYKGGGGLNDEILLC